MATKEDTSSEVYDYHFWESEVELVRKKTVTRDGKKFRYFDDGGIFSFVFFTWMYKWVEVISKRYLDPYMLHPLPLADQIIKWQPILSRHVSDGIASLEAYESLGEDEKKRAPKPVKYILWRAIWLTFWKRLLTILFLVLFINAISMSVAIFLHQLLGFLSGEDFKFTALLFLALSIVIVELFKEIGMDHLKYYVQRLAILLDACLRVVIFQHGLCYRRGRSSNFSDNPDSCKSIIHGCSGDTLCSKNPLLCPARRYKNNEVTPKMYALVINDSYYIPLFIECITNFIDFLTAFTYGMILMSTQFNMKAMTILLVSLSLVVCMVIMALVNGFLMKYYLGIRDHRITKSFEVVSSLYPIEKISLDDVAHDTITEARNDELVFVVTRFFLSLVNKVIFTVIICLDIILVVNDFMVQVGDASNIEHVSSSGLLASIIVIMKFFGPLYMVTIKLHTMVITLNSFLRVERFFRTCSPNFYLPDNKFTGEVSLPEALPDKDKTVPKGLLVMFKKASFAWVNSRRDLLDKMGTTCLENLDFILNTGDLAIVTGAHGSGKTNFVKAILGDMTLVDGSTAVLPLSTNMPIFYASQDVLLQYGTIRSNITFGHKFDEDIYNTVIKAIELEHDISTWEGGDMRRISEHGYSLSGGQRVRVGLARAIYAYLIYSEMNEENGSRHSFLVVIDDSFTGLDPFVARTIFRNLFSSKDGLLVKDDVATILTISKRILGECVSSESSTSFMDATIYNLRDKTLVRRNDLKSLIDNEVGHLEPPKPSVDRMKLPRGSHDILGRCRSNDCARFGRRRSTEYRYSNSPTVKNIYNKINSKGDKNDRYKSLHAYFRAAGWPIVVFFFFTITFATLDNAKLIITSKVSDSVLDYVREHGETSLEDISNYTHGTFRWIVAISVTVMIGALFRISAMTKASFNVSRRIHEYCINSVFVNSSAVLKIKKSLGNVITFLYMDTFLIDNEMGYNLHDTCILLIESSVHILTLMFLVPHVGPIAIILCFIILRFVVYYYVRACKNIYFARLETFNQMDSIIESAISGPSVFRSFKKEWELVHNLTEHVEYNLRCLYLSNSAMIWSSIVFKCLLSPLALFLLAFPLIRSRWNEIRIQVGYYAMAYSVFLSLITTFANFLHVYCHLEICLVPMTRFENFVPPNTPVVFAKKRNINRTDVIVDHSGSSGGDSISDDNIKSSIRTRRRSEYAERRANGCNKIKMMFFKHRVNVFDLSKYTTQGETRIKLDNVSVYVTSNTSKEKYPILKNVTCSAGVSDIIGIIGRTGAGKSTLLSVLQNLARNRDGSVLLDGCDLKDLPKAVTRQVIGVLPQLPFVFRGWTVRRFVDPRMLFDDIDINMALENCGLIKLVENLSGGKGLDTIILPEHYHKDLPTYLKRVYYGPSLKPHESSVDNVNVDYGAALSNSQLRTLSVARLVLYREFFRVLLIDEPPEDESGSSTKTIDIPIYELVKKHFKHCATFIAAHDAGILNLCTSVWVFHQGSLIRTCKAEDIMGDGSLSKIIEDCISQHT